MNYLDTVNKRTLEYFKVLEPDFPEWLWEYINTEALFKQNYISVLLAGQFIVIYLKAVIFIQV